MDFPRILDFSEVETVPMALLNFDDYQVNDVMGRPLSKRAIHREPLDVIRMEYPRIYDHIRLLWGTQEMQDRFARWLLCDQEGRNGWPVHISAALIELEDLHARTFQLEAQPKWGEKPDRW